MMELKLNVSKVLLLDTPFKREMLANNQAVIGEIEGETVMMMKVDIKDINAQVKNKPMRFFESNHPYYALIAAEDKGEAVQLYIANVAGDSEESADIEEELKEVSRDYALTKIKRSPGENGESLTEEEAIKELNQSNRVILIDGSLL